MNVNGSTLGVSNGVADAIGYANWVFADPDPESWLTPGPGPSQLSTLPGFEVHDMLAGQDLSLEILSRPDFSRPGRPARWLWHWNLAADSVALATGDPPLTLTSTRGFPPNVSLVTDTAPANLFLKMFTLTADDIDSHEHVVLYRLDDAGPAPTSASTVFLRDLHPLRTHPRSRF